MRKKLDFPLIDDEGYIIVETVNSLSFEGLQNWIKAVLKGKDPVAGGERDDLPHGFLKRVYHQLDPLVREAFQDAVLNHLTDLTQDPQSEWQGESGDELLLLVAAVLRNSPRLEDVFILLLHIAEQDSFRASGGLNLHWRALQTLIGVRYRASSEFWHEQYKAGGDTYASITLAGLSLNSLVEVFEWVKREAGNNAVVTALIGRLPWLIEEYGEDQVSLLLSDLILILPEPYETELQKLVRCLGLELWTDFQKIFIKELSNEKFKELIQMHDWEMPEELTETPEKQRPEIEKWLRDYADNYLLDSALYVLQTSSLDPAAEIMRFCSNGW
jgi:hypothetical protein